MSFLAEASRYRWQDLLATAPHDFYARPDVVALEAKWLDCHTEAFFYGDSLVPLLVRTLPEPFALEGHDAVSPYGYPGVVSASRDGAAETVRAFQAAGAARGLVSTFLRLHPVLNEGLEEALVDVKDLQTVSNGTTLAINLAHAEEEWLASLKPSSRYELRQLEKRGYEVKQDAEGSEKVFSSLYRQTMQRIGAHASYLYDDTYLHRLIQVLGDEATVLVVEAPDGNPACAGLFVQTGDIVQYHLSGSDARYRKFSPTRLMLSAARQWASQRGACLLHLGGGVGGQEDSLFAFKKDLCDVSFRYTTVRVIHDARRYEILARRRAEEQGKPLREDYFPAYRQ